MKQNNKDFVTATDICNFYALYMKTENVVEIHKMLYIYNIMIYNRIKILRTEKRLSRKDLADAVGVNFQTIGYLERGDYNASLELAFKLAEFFEVPIDMAFSPRPFKTMSEQLAAQRAAE